MLQNREMKSKSGFSFTLLLLRLAALVKCLHFCYCFSQHFLYLQFSFFTWPACHSFIKLISHFCTFQKLEKKKLESSVSPVMSRNTHRVAKCHGFGGLIRVKFFASWGKKFGGTCNFAKSSLFLEIYMLPFQAFHVKTSPMR